jgi:hypothetical protein
MFLQININEIQNGKTPVRHGIIIDEGTADGKAFAPIRREAHPSD